ncbi:A24 family peptidase [Limimaricola variabilis]|uniref:A24 family peptidase n=1 Tax=Limimaricola variabilis TaxID=1492771 RepID=UPI002AC8BFFD|nr:prepilin peptidase [Limimaricola variabilis]WPY94135.1 prepilin peptidase [Limimaricola variabilis]
MDDLPLILVAPLMAAMIWTDLRHMRIPNLLVGAVALVGLGCALAGLMPDLGMRLMAGVAVFAVGLALFALRVMGGGDVKMLAVLVPLVPPAALPSFALLLSMTMLAGVLMLSGLRRVAGGPESSWAGLRAQGRYPLGLSIAAAAMILPMGI